MPTRFTQRLLDHVGDRRYSPVSLHELVETLGVPEDQVDAFRDAVNHLLEHGQLVLGTNNTVGLPPPGKEMIGTYRGHRRGFGFIIPDEASAHGDLFVPNGRSGEAMPGDKVKARLVKDRRGGPNKGSGFIGQIIEVIQRADKAYVGTLKKQGRIWIVEVDGNALPDPVVVPDAESSRARGGDKVVVEITQYPDADDDTWARGVITEVLGESGEPDVETRSVMRAYGLAEQFPGEVLQDARAAAQKMDDPGPGRDDLRDMLTVTIDPPDAKDFDDAITLESFDTGPVRWRLGVHIADVTHFVEPGSALDTEGHARGNSTYLPKRVIPMLPEVLSNGVCSLQPEVPRLTKSVFIDYGKDGHVLAQRFCDGIINSDKRFTYLEAQAIIEGDLREARKHAKTEPKYPRAMTLLLKELDQLAKTIRQRRLKQGMIVLGLPEVELVFDDSGRVVDAQPEDDAFTHTVIEMCMVEANEAAARLFDTLGLPMIRRIHPDPDAHGLSELRGFARVAGYNIPKRPSREELQTLLEAVRGKPAQMAVHMAVLRTLSKAEYSPMLIGHFALAGEHYTHFTSPIRRYPDLVLHRALGAVMAAQRGLGLPVGVVPKGEKDRRRLARTLEDDPAMPGEDALTELGRHCSTTERNSEQAERELRKFLVLELLTNMLGDDFAATVTGVTGQGAFLQLDHFLVDGFVPASDLPGGRADRWQLNRQTGALVAQRSGRTITIGDRFTARIATIDLTRREMELVIVEQEGSSTGRRRNLKQVKSSKGKPPKGDGQDSTGGKSSKGGRNKRTQGPGAKKSHQKSMNLKKRRGRGKKR